jgi:hypothetical protein
MKGMMRRKLLRHRRNARASEGRDRVVTMRFCTRQVVRRNGNMMLGKYNKILVQNKIKEGFPRHN